MKKEEEKRQIKGTKKKGKSYYKKIKGFRRIPKHFGYNYVRYSGTVSNLASL